LKKTIILTLVFLLCITGILYAQENLKIYFLDVGQGDASLIISPSGKVAMIDSGPDESLILSYLKNLNISHIDLIFASHAHSDHITSMDKVITKYKPTAFIDPGIPHTTKTYTRMITAIEQNHINYYEGTSRKINLGSLIFTILPPANPFIHESELNNNSTVVRLDYKDFSCLFTGDIEEEREGQLIVYSNNSQNVDILKVGHHGSFSSSTLLFIRSVKPEMVVICCGQGNNYGHSHQETLNLLQILGINIYRTDLSRNILVETNDIDYQVFTEKKNIRAPPVIKTQTNATEAQ
jgi:competence protein ComEC